MNREPKKPTGPRGFMCAQTHVCIPQGWSRREWKNGQEGWEFVCIEHSTTENTTHTHTHTRAHGGKKNDVLLSVGGSGFRLGWWFCRSAVCFILESPQRRPRRRNQVHNTRWGETDRRHFVFSWVEPLGIENIRKDAEGQTRKQTRACFISLILSAKKIKRKLAFLDCFASVCSARHLRAWKNRINFRPLSQLT